MGHPVCLRYSVNIHQFQDHECVYASAIGIEFFVQRGHIYWKALTLPDYSPVEILSGIRDMYTLQNWRNFSWGAVPFKKHFSAEWIK